MTVSVKLGPPATADVGLSEAMDGTGFPAWLMVKVTGGEVSSTAAPWFRTVTCAVPAAAISEAGITAVTCVLLINVVCRAAPFHWTVAVMSRPPKPLPFTVRVNWGPPAVAELGFSEEMAGAA